MEPTVHATTDEALAVQRSVWRQMGPTRRLEQAPRMSDEVRELSILGVMARCPELTRREAMLAVVRQTHGDELFEAAVGR